MKVGEACGVFLGSMDSVSRRGVARSREQRGLKKTVSSGKRELQEADANKKSSLSGLRDHDLRTLVRNDGLNQFVDSR